MLTDVVSRSASFTAELYGRKAAAHHLFFLPGVLARGAEQARPVRSVLSQHAAVWTFTYTSKHWQPEKLATDIAGMAKSLLANGRSTTLFGVSVGGLLAAEVVKYLSPDERKLVKVMVVDSPFGPDSLMAVTGPIRAFFTSGTYRILGQPGGGALMQLFRQPPKDENIEVPKGTRNVAAFKEEVKKIAIESLSGHRWSLYGSQVVWMCSPTLDLQALRDVPSVTYFTCVSDKNDTIRQPYAVDGWKAMLPNLKVVEVDTAHAAFLEAAPTWSKVLQQHF